MIEVLPESKGNLLVLRAAGRLTRRDYTDVIIPRLQAVIRDHGKVRFLLDDFGGWQVAALWEDARFGLSHRNDFEKIGVVGGPGWVVWALKLVALVMRCEIRTFSSSEWTHALSWVKT
jgi:SpoIIAA-like